MKKSVLALIDFAVCLILALAFTAAPYYIKDGYCKITVGYIFTVFVFYAVFLSFAYLIRRYLQAGRWDAADKVSPLMERGERLINTKYATIRISLIILAFWIVPLVFLYPGTFINDTWHQLQQFMEYRNGIDVLKDHNPIFDTVVMGQFIVPVSEMTGEWHKVIFVYVLLQAVITTVVVDLALVIVHLLAPSVLSLPAAITLGAIAAATAPAATLMVVRQYKAKGPLTDLLLPIVALDDAVGLVLFAVSFGIAEALGNGAVDVYSVVLNPLLEIFCSLILGALAGWVLTQLEKLFHSNRNRVAMTIGFVFLTVALAKLELPLGKATLGVSPLLVCMMLGSVFCNLCPLSDEIMERADKWSSPLMVLFFVLSGAELELGVFAKLSSVLVGLVYIVSRCLGKYFGARESTRMMRCGPKVVRYLGITLWPQAGVALGMCVTAAQLPGDGSLIRNIVLFAVLVYELLGPVMTKWALTKAGDIQPKSEEVLRRRERKLAQAAKQ